MLLLALLGTPAHALDFGTLVESWTLTTNGQAGVDGHDQANAVEIGDNGDIVVVGTLDGALGHGHDGYAVGYAPNGTVSWEMVHDAGVIGPDRTTSEDFLYDVAIDSATGGIALCGGRGSADLSAPPVRFLVEAYDAPVAPDDPAVVWTRELVDGNAATTPVQECRGVDWHGGYVVPAGWSVHGADVGRWYAAQMAEADGFIGQAPYTYDYSQYEAVPDQALDVAVSSASGSIAVVGTRGASGLAGSDLNDADWHVRHYDAFGTLLWTGTFAGQTMLEDRANAVAIDPATGDVVVAGWTNKGSDNAGQQDLDWLVIRYDTAGDGAGNAVMEWSQTYESDPLASEGATAIAFDEVGDVLVGGWTIDPATGVERWRVAKLAFYDGVEMQEWLGPVHAGDSRLLDLDYNDDKLAMVGYVDAGAGRDFAATMLEGDLDGDTWGDSVDACPNDPEKSADTGICGCNVPDDDYDGDGVAQCDDACADDPLKWEGPGACGCNVAEDDDDGDGTPNCNDNCPEDPNKVENDRASGGCGCGAPNIDTDGDSVLNCRDACSNTPPGETVNEFGCPPDTMPGDTDGPGTDDGAGGGSGGGCGCDSAGGGSLAALGALALLALRRRRRL